MKSSRVIGCALFGILLLAALVSMATAPAGRYTITNGTVYDTKTKLTWQQSPASSTMAQVAAGNYCNGLGTWRLPTVMELGTIVDYSVANPSIDGNAFANTPANSFWTSTPYNPASGNAWAVSFGTGAIVPGGTTSSFYVRCVH